MGIFLCYIKAEGSATCKNPVQGFKSLNFYQDFKDYMARFQIFRAEFHGIRNN